MKALLLALLVGFGAAFWGGVFLLATGRDAPAVQPVAIYTDPKAEELMELLHQIEETTKLLDEMPVAMEAARSEDEHGPVVRPYQPKPYVSEEDELMATVLKAREEMEKGLTPEQKAERSVDALILYRGVQVEPWEREALIGCAMAGWQGEMQDEAFDRIVKR